MLRTQCQLLRSVSLDLVRSGLSNMHRCRAFPFALARFFVGLVARMEQQHGQTDGRAGLVMWPVRTAA